VARILSYPFRFGIDGRAAVVEQDSETGVGEQIAVLALTRTGERRLRPGFGVSDPVFVGFSPSELAAKLQLYGPPVELGDITVRPRSADVQAVEILFEPAAAA
jgi:hypothetical protein